MKNQLKKIGTVCLMATMGMGMFTSCDDDPAPVAFDARVDAFVQKIKVGEETKYVPTFYAYANKNLKSVTAINGEKTYTLAKYAHGGDMNFKYVATGDEILDAMPAEATFSFTVTPEDSGEQVKKLDDKVTTDELGEMQIKEIAYENATFKVKWDKLENAGSFAVKALDSEGNLLFVSQIIKNTDTEFTFGPNTYGWLDQSKQFAANTDYKIELHAFRYEANSTDKLYNVQFVSVGEKTAKWAPAE